MARANTQMFVDVTADRVSAKMCRDEQERGHLLMVREKPWLTDAEHQQKAFSGKVQDYCQELSFKALPNLSHLSTKRTYTSLVQNKRFDASLEGQEAQLSKK